jgi:biopolymer transport protein ExbD
MAVIRKRGALREVFGEAEWEMPVSFIDVVFLLLLFFMIAGKFHAPEGILKAEHRMGSARPPEEPLLLSVRASGASLEVPEYRIRQWTTTSPTELAAQLGRLNRAAPISLAIRGDAGCPCRHVIAALDACARAGVTKVGFTPPEPG